MLMLAVVTYETAVQRCGSDTVFNFPGLCQYIVGTVLVRWKQSIIELYCGVVDASVVI